MQTTCNPSGYMLTVLHFLTILRSTTKLQFENTYILNRGEYYKTILQPLLYPPPGVDTDRGVKDLFRINRKTFFLLLREVLAVGYKGVGNMPPEECLCIFLSRMATGVTYRTLHVQYQRCRKYVVYAVQHITVILRHRLYEKYVVRNPISWGQAWSMYIASNRQRHLRSHPGNDLNIHFHRCVGAIDGTLIKCHFHGNDPRKWSRKKFRAYNVLVVVDMLGQFRFLAVGSGSNHDSTILKTVYRNLRIPESTYLLGDAGFPYTPSILTPYRQVRYHLSEWTRDPNLRPQTPKELYNKRHSSMRMVVEMAIGRLKNTWKILSAARLNLKNFVLTVDVLAALHNFVLHHESAFHVREEIEAFVAELIKANNERASARTAEERQRRRRRRRRRDPVPEDEDVVALVEVPEVEEQEDPGEAPDETGLCRVRIGKPDHALRDGIAAGLWQSYRNDVR